MSNRQKWDLRFLEVAKLVSTWSKDPSTQCGAVIVDTKREVQSVGYNAFPRLMPDSAEIYADRTSKYSRIIHCEVNALNAVRDRNALVDATLYTWPCITCDRCFVQMVNVGIRFFVAPTATEDMNSRWGNTFELVRKYLREINEERTAKNMPLVEMIEYPGLHEQHTNGS